jgi:hypothetical protein
VTREKFATLMTSRLNGQSDAFIQCCEVGGLDFAIEEYRLSDLPVSDLHDWAQRQTAKTIFNDRGMLANPHNAGIDYARDLLDAMIEKVETLKATIKQRDETISTQARAIQYYKAFPMRQKVNDLMCKLVESCNEKR